MRLLLVEDDQILSDVLVKSLGQNGYIVDLADNGQAADHALLCERYDLVLLDVGLPKLDGFQVLRRLRERAADVPVLMLTARDTLDDRVKGLDLGADDYLAKPFDLPELEARIRALLRRGQGQSSNTVTYGSLEYDRAERSVRANGVPLVLTARELSMLELLLSKAGRVVSKEKMSASLYGWGEEVGENALEVGVHRLRKKLEPSGMTVRTVRGLGYLLDKPDG